MPSDSQIAANSLLLDTRHILSVQFNQDSSCFCIGDEHGFEVFSTDPCVSLRRVVYEDGGVGLAAMLYSSNILALVGGGPLPKYPNNHIIMYDDKQEAICSQIELRAQIKTIKMRHGLLIAALTNRVFVYSIERDIPTNLAVFDAHNVEDGRLAVNTGDEAIIAFPGIQPGSIQLVQINTSSQVIKQLGIISSHDSPISCIALSPTGDKVASASQKGTLIRVYNTKTCRLIKEFRRGMDQAEINCMTFNAEGSRLAVASDKGTIHVFNITQSTGSSGATSSIKQFLPKYFSSNWSFAQLHLKEGRSVVSFVPDQQSALAIVRYDGLYLKYLLDEDRGGEAVMMSSKAL